MTLNDLIYLIKKNGNAELKKSVQEAFDISKKSAENDIESILYTLRFITGFNKEIFIPDNCCHSYNEYTIGEACNFCKQSEKEYNYYFFNGIRHLPFGHFGHFRFYSRKIDNPFEEMILQLTKKITEKVLEFDKLYKDQ